MIRRSGTRCRFAATSSSSGRTRLASTVGACGPPWRTSQRVTSTSTPLAAAPSRVGRDRLGLDVAGEHRRPAELRGGDRQHAAAAAPVGERAVRLDRVSSSSVRRVVACEPVPNAWPGLDHDVQRAVERRLPRRAHAQAGARRPACGSCASPRRAARSWRRRRAARRPRPARRRSPAARRARRRARTRRRSPTSRSSSPPGANTISSASTTSACSRGDPHREPDHARSRTSAAQPSSSRRSRSTKPRGQAAAATSACAEMTPDAIERRRPATRGRAISTLAEQRRA